MRREKEMKAIVLGGFLGAGKTSILLQLINYLLAQDSNLQQSTEVEGDGHSRQTIAADYVDTNTKVAIIENEIGQVGIDGATLSGAGVTLRELVSGCICCSLSGELEATVRVLQWQLNPEWLLVEATGLAYPDKTVENVRKGAAHLSSLKLIVLVDAARFRALKTVSPLINAQIIPADLLILNKVDLASDTELDFVRGQLRALNPNAQILEVSALEPLTDDFFKAVTADE